MIASGALPIVFDGITAVAVALGAFAAWRGVSTWRQQLIGQDEYELAKRLLGGAFEFEALIKRIRLGYELTPPLWEKLDGTCNDLDVAFAEARVLWGESTAQRKAAFKTCTTELDLAKLDVGELSAMSAAACEQMSEQIIKTSSPILHGKAGDEFGMKVHSAVTSLEDYLRPHLQRHKPRRFSLFTLWQRK